MSKPLITMEAPFSIPSSNANSIDILKHWVKGPAKFQDDTQPDLQDEDIAEGVSVLGHLCISLVRQREHGDLLVELGDFIGPTG